MLTVVSLSPVDRYKAGLASYSPQSGLFANRRHRIVHWVSFGGLAFVLALLGRNTKQRVLASATAAGLGVVIEYLQCVIYLNALETWDIRDDLCASLVGLTGALCLIHISGRSKAKRSVDRI